MPSSQSFCWETLVAQSSRSNPADSCTDAERKLYVALLGLNWTLSATSTPETHCEVAFTCKLSRRGWCRNRVSGWASRQRCWVQKNGFWKHVCEIVFQTKRHSPLTDSCNEQSSEWACHQRDQYCLYLIFLFFKICLSVIGCDFRTRFLLSFLCCLLVETANLVAGQSWFPCPVGWWLARTVMLYLQDIKCWWNPFFCAQHHCLLTHFPLLAQEIVANTTSCHGQLLHGVVPLWLQYTSVLSAHSAFSWITRVKHDISRRTNQSENRRS